MRLSKIDLNAFRLSVSDYEQCLDREQLAKLSIAFNERFPTWNLFVRTHAAIDDRKFYGLYAIRTISVVSDGEYQNEQENLDMRSFINGFMSAAKHLKSK